MFGYGSLMWRPGFTFEECQQAMLHGYHRDMCILSIRYRGTPEVPGLVLGLNRGGSCQGRAYRVAPEHIEATKTYLRERELVTGVYKERMLAVTLENGTRVRAYGFVADTTHGQYRGGLSDEEAASIILQGHGLEGPARDYLVNSIVHLEEMGIRDSALNRLRAACDRLAPAAPAP